MVGKHTTLIIVLSIIASVIITLLIVLCIFMARDSDITIPDIHENQKIGSDWRTWRGYSSDYEIEPGFSVTFSPFDPDEDSGISEGYAVYDATYGSRFASIVLTLDDAKQIQSGSMNFLCEDRDGDGKNDIGITLKDGRTLWYSIGFSTDDSFYRCPIIDVSE